MPRLIVAILLIIPFAAVGLWLNARPGVILIDWLGMHIRLSHMALFVLFSFALIITITLSVLIHGLMQWPKQARLSRQLTRHTKAMEALTQGLSAYAIGDYSKAKSAIVSATRALPHSALPHLLAAQANMQSSTPQKALPHLRALTMHKTTAYIGYRRLIEQAKTTGNTKEYTRLLADARKQFPTDRWLAERFIVQQLQQNNFDAAIGYISGRHWRHAFSKTMRQQLAKAIVLYQLQQQDDASIQEFLPYLSQPATCFAAAEMMLAHIDAENAPLLYRPILRQYRNQPAKPLRKLLLALYPLLDMKTQKRLIKFAQKLAKTQADAGLLLAQLWLNQGNITASASAAETAFNQLASKEAALMVAQSYQEMDAHQQAQHWYQQAVNAPQTTAIWQCGQCGHQANNWQIFCPACEAVLSVNWQENAPVIQSPLPATHT